MTNPIKTNPLGQITDSVVEQITQTTGQVAKAVVSEPAKILEQILGGSTTGDPQSGETATEQGVSSTSPAQMSQQAQEMLSKQQESQHKSEELYKQHQLKLQEEIEYHQKSVQKKEQQEQVEAQQDDQKKQVVQLKREQEDEALWQQQIKAVQGSHEGQQGKM